MRKIKSRGDERQEALPGSRAPADRDERLKLWRAVPEAEQRRINRLVWRRDEAAFNKQLADFIRANETPLEEALRELAKAKKKGKLW